MNKLVVRHGLSQANNRANYGTPAFGSPDASLMDEGIVQATNAGVILRENYLIDPSTTTVAVSKMRRTWETANFAGFHTLRPYESLNEAMRGLTLEQIQHIKDTREFPLPALQAAEEVLNNPPEEDIWFTHGLVIASMCKILDVHQEKSAVPTFCEIRELPL
jgi:broad specificity phosphatase PhoE